MRAPAPRIAGSTVLLAVWVFYFSWNFLFIPLSKISSLIWNSHKQTLLKQSLGLPSPTPSPPTHIFPAALFILSPLCLCVQYKDLQWSDFLKALPNFLTNRVQLHFKSKFCSQELQLHTCCKQALVLLSPLRSLVVLSPVRLAPLPCTGTEMESLV